MDQESAPTTNGTKPSDSASQASETSQTAQDYIASQLSLEADAREALPYQFDTCTKPLGPLRQSVYACLTCNPPPASKYQQFTPAGVCYSCSISCHGEHNLVELFTKRDFVCDCGTTRMSNSGTPCSLRLNVETSRKGGVVGEEAREGNKYNQNFEGKFCGCGEEYDPEKEKGTMFQCLGLGTVAEGGCGEDWWHPECLLELPRIPHEPKPTSNGNLDTVKEEDGDGAEALTANGEQRDEDDPPLPPGFPHEDDFDHLICYKCVNAFPWIKQYANSEGFLTAKKSAAKEANGLAHAANGTLPQTNGESGNVAADSANAASETKKRKAEDDPEDSQDNKKVRADQDPTNNSTTPSEPQGNGATPQPAKHTILPPAPAENTTLFLTPNFRDHLCKCPTCFPLLARHKSLLEDEESYEPPLSESEDSAAGGGRRSVNSGSILERGEAALNNMDRVRAIEGVMAYNHVRDKVKDFLKPFAEEGRVVSAEEVRDYFAKLRGDEAVAREVGVGGGGDEDGEKDFRREQGGY